MEGKGFEYREPREQEPKAKIATIELRGQRAEQQDAHASFESEHNGVTRFTFAVADGHGTGGDKVAKYAATRIVHDLAEEPKLDAPTIRERFADLQAAIVNDHRNNGATLTVAIREGDKLTTAYVGDSEAWMFADGKMKRRTVPHRFKDHAHETDRLERSPVRIENGYIVVSSTLPYASEESAKRIQVTRSLGDEDFEPYLSHEPQIETITLKGNEKFLLIGSDGFWNAATLRSRSRHAIEHALATSETAELAQQKIASILSRREIHDNATVMIIELR
jgi:serine/threonine protein phosphatase PrpC